MVLSNLPKVTQQVYGWVWLQTKESGWRDQPALNYVLLFSWEAPCILQQDCQVQNDVLPHCLRVTNQVAITQGEMGCGSRWMDRWDGWMDDGLMDGPPWKAEGLSSMRFLVMTLRLPHRETQRVKVSTKRRPPSPLSSLFLGRSENRGASGLTWKDCLEGVYFKLIE